MKVKTTQQAFFPLLRKMCLQKAFRIQYCERRSLPYNIKSCGCTNTESTIEEDFTIPIFYKERHVPYLLVLTKKEPVSVS